MGCCVSNKFKEEGGKANLQLQTTSHITGSQIDEVSVEKIIGKTMNHTNISNINSEPSNQSESTEIANNLIIDVAMPLSVGIIPIEEVDKGPKLNIEVVEGTAIPRNTILNINPQGLVSSQRKAFDGCVFFGTQPSDPKTNQFVNDYVCPSTEQGMGKKHFLIRYNMDARMYFVKDMGDGTGTFVRVDKPLPLKHGYIISFGDSHLVVQIRLNNKIQLRFLDGPKTDQTFTFFPIDKTIKIGRLSDCDIKFDDNALSRYQCCIEMIDSTWVLKDCDGQRLSTNGTWLFVDELFPIFNGMIFKAGQTLFKTCLLEE